MINLTLTAYNRRQYTTINFDTALFFSNTFNGVIVQSGFNYIVTI